VKGSLLASSVNYAAYKYHDLRKVFHKVSRIVCPSNFTATKFRENYRLKNLSTVHIPTFVSEEILLGSQSISNEVNKSIGYWGRIDHDKGIHTLLDAMKNLYKNLPDVTLTLIGNGDEQYVQKMRQKIIDDGLNSVVMVPFLQKDQLFKIISDFDLVIVPSLWYDNMPNSLLEAQAYGIPAIVSNNGSLKELVHHGFNGYHFESGNPADLAKTIINYYLNEKDIALMKINSAAWAQEHYSSGKHYERLISVFDEVLSER
jgi:glycosyltransferase involved in cell wall biosynthesis